MSLTSDVEEAVRPPGQVKARQERRRVQFCRRFQANLMMLQVSQASAVPTRHRPDWWLMRSQAVTGSVSKTRSHFWMLIKAGASVSASMTTTSANLMTPATCSRTC